jgi:hypothetical protein
VAINNGYATLTEIKAAARIPVSDTVDDSLLESAIESASRLIDQHCERRFFTNGTETRVYATHDYYWCDIDDVAGTAITIKTASNLDRIYDQTWAATDYQLEPVNRIQAGVAFPVTRIRAVGDYLFTPSSETTVEVTGVFGFATAVPTQVKQATIIEALRLYKRLDSPLGFAGFGDMGVARVSSRIDPDVAMLLSQFRKQAPGVA